MSEPFSIVVTRSIQASPAEVCRGFTHATLLRDWLCHEASSGPYEGGYLFLRWRNGRTVTGAYEQFDLPRRLSFSWLDTELPGTTVVQVNCEAEGERTRLTLTHSGRGELSTPGEAVSGLEAFWNDALENLASVVETGVDLRFARRPRLGIYMEEFTPEVARKLGVPVDKGVLLDGTGEGTGARAAGLMKGDVLTSLNGVPLVNPDSFDAALSGLKAGDRPVVEYYRAGEKKSVPLELSSFPIPELPASARELAEKVRELSAELMTALRAQLEGVSEEQASMRPAEGEWSANEQVAHYILMERDYQSWVADMLNDQPVDDWLKMRPNVQPRIDALVARLESLPALLDELALARDETVAMIAAFPESFVLNRKHLYQRAVLWEIDGMPGHYEEHREQFQAALQAAG